VPPTSFSQSSYRFTHVGMDVHRDSISVGILPPDLETPEVERIGVDDVAVRALFSRLGDPGCLRACYEAGPTGYDLARLLRAIDVHCDVVAPSLIPRAPGDRVKTDKRDCRRLARLHRMGELRGVRVPTPTEEGLRDLCRARRSLLIDRRRARQRLTSMLLRHGQVYRTGSLWTQAHRDWLGTRRFERYRGIASVRDADVAAIEADLEAWCDTEVVSDTIRRLVCYRGIDRLGALTLAVEVCDWHRFASAHAHMAFCGLVPTEASSGPRVWRGGITKTGNVHVRTQLIESAWAYHYPARLSRAIAARQAGAEPDTVARAWRAQLRLTHRFRALAATKAPSVVVTAVARELAGFVWAEMTA